MKNKVFIIVLIFLYCKSFAQDKNDTVAKKIIYTEKSFFCNRIINAQSLENTPKGKLEFKFYHRMGSIDLGLAQFEQAYSLIGFEYGFNERLMLGISRSTTQGLNNGFLKYKILRQQSGTNNIPFSILGYTSMCINSKKWDDKTRKNLFISRMSFTNQLIIGSKINKNLSIEIIPTLVHRNLVKMEKDKNDVFALGIGGRYKITRKIALDAECFYLLPNQIHSQINNLDVQNSLSLGIEMNTGRHVFTVLISNSIGTVEPAFIAETNGKINNKGLHLGFNMTRLFNIKN